MRKARLDSKQKKFDYTTAKIAKPKKPKIPAVFNTIVGDVLCPFCLHKDKVRKFIRSTKKGFHKSLGTCPECKQGMRLKSLAAKWTPTEFAKWVIAYPFGYFWKKCIFKKFNDRLYRLGWSYEFWGAYKKNKPQKNKEDDYAQYLVDMGITPDDS